MPGCEAPPQAAGEEPGTELAQAIAQTSRPISARSRPAVPSAAEERLGFAVTTAIFRARGISMTDMAAGLRR